MKNFLYVLGYFALVAGGIFSLMGIVEHSMIYRGLGYLFLLLIAPLLLFHDMDDKL